MVPAPVGDLSHGKATGTSSIKPRWRCSRGINAANASEYFALRKSCRKRTLEMIGLSSNRIIVERIPAKGGIARRPRSDRRQSIEVQEILTTLHSLFACEPRSILMASDASSLARSLSRWEVAEYFSCALVALGCAANTSRNLQIGSRLEMVRTPEETCQTFNAFTDSFARARACMPCPNKFAFRTVDRVSQRQSVICRCESTIGTRKIRSRQNKGRRCRHGSRRSPAKSARS